MQVKHLLNVMAIGLLWIAGAQATGFEKRAAVPAPDLQAREVDGSVRSMADFRGKVVVVNFWATWCPPCQREMPSLERLRAKMAGRPLAIVAVSSAEAPDDVKAYLSRMKLGFPVWLDPDSDNTRRWKVFALPTTFLLDAAGRVRYVLTGPAEWDEGEALALIESLLAERPESAKQTK